jgi:endonuclease/exonuclease/phosphatase family metal-dependent hydrolase
VRGARGRSRRRVLGLVVIVLLTLGSCSPPAPPPPGASLRVMTWNVETHAHDPGEWADVVARLRPDVLALQEICAGEVDELAAILRRDHGLVYRSVPGPIRPPTPQEASAPVNAALGPACHTGPEDVAYGLAVLSRLPVSEETITIYPPDHRDEQRGFMTVRVAAGPASVRILNTHIGLAGVQADQLRRLADAAAGTDPTVVVGDLNVGVDDPELAPLRQGFAEVDPDGRYPTTSSGKVDYVFVRGLTPVAPPEAPPVTSSDHRPLVGTFDVAPGPTP